MKQKIKKQNSRVYVIVVLFIILFSLAAGYAIFNESLNINGTAITTGNFDVEFTSSVVTSSSNCNPTSAISADKKNLTISILDLNTPGANARIKVTVKNSGNVTSILKSVLINGANDSDIKITYENFETGTLLQPSQISEFYILVKWDVNSGVNNKSITFSATLNYEQSV